MGIPASLLIHSFQRIRPTTATDAHNTTTRTYSGSGTAMTGRFQQDKATETFQEGRTPQVRNWTLFTNESDITTFDRILFGTLTFDVDAPPAPKYDGVGFHHLEVALKLVEG